MARTQPRTPPTPAPSPEERAPSTNRLLSPRVTLPALAAMTTIAVVLGVLFFLFRDDSEAQPLTVTTCQAGTPGCELRAPTHIHANLALVIRGQKFDFNKPQFVSVEGDDKSAIAHIHEPRHSVVHVHRTGTSWDEFLRSVGFELTDPTYSGTTNVSTCLKVPGGEKLCANDRESFKFYVNGVKIDGVALSKVADLDRVLISFGSEPDEVVVAQQLPLVGADACIPSERCKDRIPKDEPPEPCTISNDTCVKAGS